MTIPKEPEMTQLSDVAMSLVGSHVAYIKPVTDGKVTGYAVHAADGTQLAIFESFDEAFYTARIHDLEPVQIH